MDDIPRRSTRHHAFTLVELLVVVGIISLLIAILLPVLSGARKTAQTVQCSNNLRQICTALLGYASDHRGRFPINAANKYWYDADRIGGWLSIDSGEGGVLVCPEDDGSRRSYSMNHWASSKVDPMAALARTVWSTNLKQSSQLILVTESWSSTGSATVGWKAQPTVCRRGNDAGRLFGAQGGVAPFSAGRWGYVNCELTYNRHRSGNNLGTQPVGKINIGYADGHVETVAHDALADSESGLSTFHSLWSELDYQYP